MSVAGLAVLSVGLMAGCRREQSPTAPAAGDQAVGEQSASGSASRQRNPRADAALEAITVEGAKLREQARLGARLLATMGDETSTYVFGYGEEKYEAAQGEDEQTAAFKAGRITTLDALVEAIGPADEQQPGSPVPSWHSADLVAETHWWGDVGVGVNDEQQIAYVAVSVSPVALVCAEATVQKQNHKLERAISRYEDALAAEPNLLEAHWGIAWCASSKGDKAKAREHFQKVVELDSGGAWSAEAQKALERLRK
ncbi:MAG: tetratricopeptide repeat protein [Armatimonadota bacterium]